MRPVKTDKELLAAYVMLLTTIKDSIVIGNTRLIKDVVKQLRDEVAVSGDLTMYSTFLKDGTGYVLMAKKAIEDNTKREDMLESIDSFIEIAKQSTATGQMTLTNLDEIALMAAAKNGLESSEELPDDATQEEIVAHVDKKVAEQLDELKNIEADIAAIQPKDSVLPVTDNSSADSKLKTVLYGAGAVIAVGLAIFIGAKAVSAVRDIGSGDIIINE